jgi:hypothetical protein
MTEQGNSGPKKHGTETRRKGALLAFRVAPEERAEIETAAEAEGLTVGSFIRGKILIKIRTQPKRKPALDRVLLGQILGQLGKLGGNLNQIAKKLNEGQRVDAGRITAATSEFSRLREELLNAIRILDNGYQGEIQRGGGSAGGVSPSQR